MRYPKFLQSKVDVFSLHKTHSKSRLSIWLTFGTAIAAAQINYVLLGNYYVIPLLLAIVVHEFAHYIFAKAKGADVSYPIFIPLPFIVIGITSAYNLHDSFKSEVAIVGIIFASLFHLLMILFTLITPIFNPITFALFMFFEILFNIIGSDGAKYRKYRKA
jgi:hypothetical protein